MSKQKTGIEKVLTNLKKGQKVKSVSGLKNLRATISELRKRGYVIPDAVKGSYSLDMKKTAKNLLK